MESNKISKKRDHPIKTILMAIGLGIVAVIIINLMSFGLVFQLASLIAGCGWDDHTCTKTQLIHTIIIDVIISIPVFLLVIWFDSSNNKQKTEKVE